MGTVGPKCRRPHSVTATKPSVTNCDGNPRFRDPKTGHQT